MITSLVNGCESIIPVVRPEDGRKLLEEALASVNHAKTIAWAGKEAG